jgi:hypothetical protein
MAKLKNDGGGLKTKTAAMEQAHGWKRRHEPETLFTSSLKAS